MNNSGYEAEFLASREPSFQKQPPKLVKTPSARHSLQSHSGREFSPLLYTIKKSSNNKNKLTDVENMEEQPSSLLEYNGSRASFSDSMESFHDKSRMSSFLNPHGSSKNSASKKPDTLLVGDVSSLPLKEQERLLQSQQNEILGLKMKIHMLQNHLRTTAPENVQQVITENVELHSQNAQLHAQIAHLNKLYKNAMHSGQHENDFRSQDNDSHKDISPEVQDLQDKICDLEYEIRRLDSDKEENNARIEDLESENHRLRLGISGEHGISVNQDESTNSEIRQRVVELEFKEEELSRREKELKEEMNDLERREQELLYEKTKFEDWESSPRASPALIEQIQELKDTIEDLEFDVRQLTAEKDSLAHKLQVVEEAHTEQLHNANNSVNVSNHESCEIERQQLLDQIARLEQSLHTVEEKLATLSRESDYLDKSDHTSKLSGQSCSQLEDQIFKLEQEKIVLDRVSDNCRNYSRKTPPKKRLTNKDLKSKIRSIKESEDSKREIEHQLILERRELDAKDKNLKSLKSLVERCQHDADGFKQERDLLQKQAHEYQDLITKLSERANETTLASGATQEEVDRLREKIQYLEQELLRVKSEYETKSKEWLSSKTIMEKKVSALETLTTNYETERENLLKNVKDTTDNQTLFRTEKKRYDQMKHSLQLEIDQKEVDMERQHRELESANQQLGNLDKEIGYLKKELEEWKQDCASAQALWEMSENEKNSLEAEVSKLQASINSLENTTAALREINSSDSKARTVAENKVHLLEKKLEDKESLIKELNRTQQKTEIEMKLLQHKSHRDLEQLDLVNKSITELKTTQNASFLGEEDISTALTWYKDECNRLKIKLKRLRKAFDSAQNSLNHQKEKAEANVMFKPDDPSDSYVRTKTEITSNPFSLHDNLDRKKGYSAEVKSMAEHLKYLKSRVIRETQSREDLNFMKKFFLKQIAAYQACNRQDLLILQEMGIYPDYELLQPKKRTLRGVAFAILASIRLKKRFQDSLDHKTAKARIIRMSRGKQHKGNR